MVVISVTAANQSAYYDLGAPLQIVQGGRPPTVSPGSVSSAGGALGGYYDQPRAVPLPILGVHKTDLASSAPSTVQEKPGPRPVARSKTFRDSSSTVNVSVLHRSLIQQPTAESNKVPLSGNEVNRGDLKVGGPSGQGRVTTAPGERVTPAVAPRSKPARSQTFSQSSDLSLDQQSRNYGDRVHPKITKSASDTPEFLFGFDATPSDGVQRQATATAATENKPVAMVQPRKVAGVRVLPNNIDLSASPIYQNQHQAQQPQQQQHHQLQQQRQQHQPVTENQLSKTPNASITAAPAFGKKSDVLRVADASKPDAQQRRKNATPEPSPYVAERRLEGGGIGNGAGVALDGGHSAERFNKEPKTDGILSLRTLRGNPSAAGAVSSRPAIQASTFSDINGNNLKAPIYGNVTPVTAGAQPSAVSSPPSSSSPSSSNAIAASRAANNFEFLRVSSEQSRGDSRSASGGQTSRDEVNGSSPQPSKMTQLRTAPMIVDGSEELNSKDKEIASVVGNMRIDYEPSTATLQAQGTNFEKYLGYFP